MGIDQRYEIHIEILYVAARSVETSTDPVAFKCCEHEKDLFELYRSQGVARGSRSLLEDVVYQALSYEW